MNKRFIGIDKSIKPPFKSTSLLLRRSFNVKNINHRFVLRAIGLGIAVYYVNGKRISDSVLCTVHSDYSKSLYIDNYDVTRFIQKGKNVIAVELGNGFYNESLETVWKFNHCHWRGDKCLYLELLADRCIIIKSDEKFKVAYSPFITYNELRAGECLDQRQYMAFQSNSFDDSKWVNAIYIDNPPQGKIRDNLCPSIKEFETYSPIKIVKSSKGYIFDFGKNMSGYVRAHISGYANKELVFRYSEDIDNKGELDLHGLDCYQKNEPFQTDKCVSDGSSFTFTPKFTYHGFRYVELSGIDDLNGITLEAVFVHQDIKFIEPKNKLDSIYQQIFDCGINSILSNTYYGFTDCPTREKLNWLNDFIASLPVILKFFECKELLKKIYQDIIDAQDESGNIPGIAPSPKWGFEYGPLCSSAAVILPYLFYKKYNDLSLFDKHISSIKKYYRFVKKDIRSNYFFLGDWTGSTNHPKTPVQFVLESYLYMMDKMLFEVTGDDVYRKDMVIREKYLLSYKVEGQSIPSVLLVFGLGDKKKIMDVLLEEISKADYHFDVGVFGFQFLFKALSMNNQDEIIRKMLCNKNAPSFKVWIDNGATSLYETFDETWSLSMNHHMFSCVILYLKNI